MLLSAGTWSEHLTLDERHEGVDLRGRCPALSLVEGPEPAPVLWAGTGDHEVRGLRLEPRGSGVWIHPNQEDPPRITLRGVQIVDPVGFGIQIDGDGTRAELREVEISGLRADEGQGGAAIYLANRVEVDLRDVTVIDSEGTGVQAWWGAELTVDGLRLIDVRPPPDRAEGWGLYADGGATVSGSGVEVDACEGRGFVVLGTGTEVRLSNLRFAGGRAPDGGAAVAVEVGHRASVELGGLVLEGNEHTGILAHALGTTLHVTDALLLNTSRDEGGTLGQAVAVRDGATVWVEDTEIRGFGSFALGASGTGTSLVARRTLVHGPDGEDSPLSDTCVYVETGASFEGEALDLRGCRGWAVLAGGPGTNLLLTGSVIEDVTPLGSGEAGIGVGIVGNAAARLADLRMVRATTAGLLVSDGASCELDGVEIEDTAPGDDGVGAGLRVDLGGRVTGRGLRVLRAEAVGVAVARPGSSLVMEDLRVEGGTSLGVHGAALSVVQGATAEIVGGALRQQQGSGFVVFGEGAFLRLVDVQNEGHHPLLAGQGGRGGEVLTGGTLEAVGLVIEGVHEAGILVAGEGSLARIVDGRIEGVGMSSETNAGVGVWVQGGGQAEITGTSILGTVGPGLFAGSGGGLRAADLTVEGAAFGGVAVIDASLSLDGVTVLGTVAHPVHGGGVALFAQGDGGIVRLDVLASHLDSADTTAIYLRGPGRYRFEDVSVEGAGRPPWSPCGLIAMEGVGPWEPGGGDDGAGDGLLLLATRFLAGSGDIILLDDSTATLGGLGDPRNNVFPAAPATPIRWQRCDGVTPPVILDDSAPQPVCSPGAIPLQPALQFQVRIEETEAVF